MLLTGMLSPGMAQHTWLPGQGEPAVQKTRVPLHVEPEGAHAVLGPSLQQISLEGVQNTLELPVPQAMPGSGRRTG